SHPFIHHVASPYSLYNKSIRPLAALHLILPKSFSPHRALHSFPTRRSSDLTPFGFYGCSAVAFRHDDLASTPHPRNPRPVFHLRSEEHTSELQSRFDLVCRLLLEKKKRCSAIPGIWPAAARRRSHFSATCMY